MSQTDVGPPLGVDPGSVPEDLPESPLERVTGVPDWQRIDLRFLRLVEVAESRYGLFAAALLVAMVAETISFLFATTMDEGYHHRFTGLSVDPFARGTVPIPYPEHRLRLLGPVLAWTLGLRGLVGTYVPIAFNVPLLMLFFLVVRRRATLPLAIVFTLLMATTHVTMSSRILLGYHDSMVFFFATLAMVCRSPWLAAMSFFLALFGDPRVALMIPLMGIWTLMDPGSERPLATSLRRVAVLVASSAAFVLASDALLRAFEYEDSSTREIERYLALEFLNAMNPMYLHLSASMTFKAGWLLALMPMWLWLTRRPRVVAILAANVLTIAGLAVMVHDFSRALTFCYPLLLLGVLALEEEAPHSALTVVSTCYAINLLTPFYQGMTKGLWLVSYPLSVEYRW